jgi:hypothetical protein
MLLLLSNSIDGTADVIVGLCSQRAQPVFRFNIDLWAQYRFSWTHEGFVFHDPAGRILSSDEIAACLWRRPSLQDTPDWEGGSPDDRIATAGELHTLMRELADWARARGLLRLIEPAGPRRVGRLTQMRVAREFFTVPDWAAGWGIRWPPGRRMVKRLTTEAIGEQRDRYIFVQSVDCERLSPEWPWLLQDIASGDRDATVLYVKGRCFGFEMVETRAQLGVEDWRIRNGAHKDKWQSWKLPSDLSERIAGYMGRLDLRFGRLDFLTGDGGESFLEVNPNGQFGWLDDPDGWPLHRAVLDAALDPTSAIRGDETVCEIGSHDAHDRPGAAMEDHMNQNERRTYSIRPGKDVSIGSVIALASMFVFGIAFAGVVANVLYENEASWQLSLLFFVFILGWLATALFLLIYHVRNLRRARSADLFEVEVSEKFRAEK